MFTVGRQGLHEYNWSLSLSLSDFIPPAGGGVDDYIGMFAVSAGFSCKEQCQK